MTTIVSKRRRHIRWRFVFALSTALVVHIGLLIVAREALRWRPKIDGPLDQPMQLRLIDVDLLPSNEESATPPLPVPALPLQRGEIARPAEIAPSIARAEKSAEVKAVPSEVLMSKQVSSDASQQQHPRLVALDGRVYIPDVDAAIAAAAARFPTKPAAPKTGASNPFSHRSPLPYVATRFDARWVPDGETLLGTFARKLADKVVKKGSRQVAGLQIDCVWILVVANCGWGLPPRISIDELKKLRADVPLPRGPNTQPDG